MVMKNFIEIDGFKLNYLIEGEGVPILCIGSSLFYSRIFSTDIKSKYKFVFIDHCGFAVPPERKIEDSEYSLDNILNHIDIIRERLSLNNFFVLGHSGHAFMALEYAKKYSKYVLGTIMVAVSPDYSDESHKLTDSYFYKTASVKRKEYYENKMNVLTSLIQTEPEKRFVHYCLCSGARNWFKYDFDASFLWENVNTNLQMIDHVWGSVFRNIKINENLDKYLIPTLLMLGKYDYVTGPVNLWDNIKSKFYNLEINIFEESGHYPMYEQSELFDSVLFSWIEKVNKQKL